VVISTRRGTDTLHGEFALYERAAALNARFPIENRRRVRSSHSPRQNYVGTLVERSHRGNCGSSRRSSTCTNWRVLRIARPARANSIRWRRWHRRVNSGVSSIAVPTSTPVPFNDFVGMARLDWKQSARSQWFLARAAQDSYLTHNDLIQQGTLPSTGATSHSNYLNLALGEQYTFSPTWVGSFLFGASGLHRTEERNDYLGFTLDFPFSATFQTVSGLNTFGDNQFATAVPRFRCCATRKIPSTI